MGSNWLRWHPIYMKKMAQFLWVVTDWGGRILDPHSIHLFQSNDIFYPYFYIPTNKVEIKGSTSVPTKKLKIQMAQFLWVVTD